MKMKTMLVVIAALTLGMASAEAATATNVLWKRGDQITTVSTDTNGVTTVVTTGSQMDSATPSITDVAQPTLTQVSIGVWSATTTTAVVIRFENYGLNSQFFVQLSPDMSQDSWRKVIAVIGEYLGARYPAPGVVEYYFDPTKLTDDRFFAIFIKATSPTSAKKRA